MLEVNERILTTILCKPGVSVPYNLHHDAEKKKSVPYKDGCELYIRIL
jgi:hypothetical protein